MGDRGYRVAQLEASIISGKLYLASYALNLAATGLTFFDDDVVQFFSPHANGKSVMFLTAIGNRAPSQARPWNRTVTRAKIVDPSERQKGRESTDPRPLIFAY